MTKPLNIIVSAIFFIFALFALSFAQETLTITTYYPSPYGSYRELRAQRMAIGDNYYGSTYCWPPNTCTNQIYTDINGNGSYDTGEDIVDLVVEGNVGIGTTGPQAKLEIAGTDNTNLLALPGNVFLTYRENVGPLYGFNITTGGIDNSLFLHTEEDGYHQCLYFGDGQYTNNVFGISTKTSPPQPTTGWNAKFVVNQNGNVGIGTASPERPLKVVKDTSSALHTAAFIDATNHIGVAIGNAGPTANYPSIQGVDDDLTGSSRYIRLILNANGGNVGIGTTSPGVKLDVNGDIRTNAGITLGGERRTTWPDVPATGTYIGNGIDDRLITVGFRPKVLVVMGRNDSPPEVRTDGMTGSKGYAGDWHADENNIIKSFTDTGFTVGTNAKVNSMGTTYYWYAF